MKKKVQFLFICAFGLLFASSAWAQQTVSGTVTAADDGTPLPNVTVLVQGTNSGTATNADGEYSVTVPEGGNILVFSSVGFETQEVNINGRSKINVQLSADVAQLDDVVVVGFGTQSRRNVTSSISSVGEEELGNIQLNTLENALQGSAPGVQVTQAGGTLGSPVAVRIRGTASINANSQPLYVVDGVPITQSGGSIGRDVSGVGIGTNPLVNLNPDDIQDIQVLKDAAASAIYGSRGSNGVVLITTKSGRPGQAQVNFSYSAGFTEATDTYDMMNGQQFTQIWNDAGTNFFDVNGFDDLLNNAFGADLTAEEWWFNETGNAAILGTDASLNPEDVNSTDWINLVQRQGFVQNVNASVSGGNEQTQYYISGSFSDEEGYIRGNQLERYSARVKVDHNISDKLKVGLNIAPTLSRNFKRSERNQVDAPITYAALYYPNVEARNDLGEPNLSIDPNAFTAFPGTPLSNLQGTDIDEEFTQTVISSNLLWNITPKLAFDTDVSVEVFQLQTTEKRSDITTDGFGTGTGLNLYSSFLNYNVNSTLTYTDNFGNHDLTALVGTSLQRNENTSFNVSGNNFASNDLKTLNSAASITAGDGDITSYAFLGYLSRISYSFKDKYLATINARVDGSSRFGEDNRYGFFPAASIGWIISDEDFLSGSETLDFLKLRASYGITGNADGIGNFPALALASAGANYDEIPGLTPGQLPNPDLRWEKAQQLDVGIDYGFFNSRLRGSLGYFDKRTSDLLLNRPISATNGFTTFTQNEGEMRNYGLEFSVTADILRGPLQWTSTFNFSVLENEVQSLIGGEDIIVGDQLVREGETLGAFFLREFAGASPEDGMAVWYLNDEPTQAQIDAGTAYINESRFGDRYVTKSYNAAQRTIAGDPFADFFGGFRNNFFYQGFDLGVFLQYNIGNEIYRADGEFTDTNLNSLFNQAERQSDYWKEEGDITDIPKPILFTANGSQSSTRYMEDGSYVRLKSATLGYTLPTSLTEGYTLRLYASGTNLLTFTDEDFRGMDPEVTSAPSNNITQGNIFFAPAQARTIQFGIDFTF